MKYKSKVMLINKSSFESFLNTKDGENLTRLGLKTRITNSYAQKLVKFFEENHLISTKKIGRDRIITLTQKGKELQLNLFKIKELLGESY